MSRMLIVFSCFLAFVYSQNSNLKGNVPLSGVFKVNRVIGGTNAARGEFPYQVSLQLGASPHIPFYHICGGSIIDERWILTAAHCVENLQMNLQLVVKAGKNRIKTRESTEQTARVERIFTHQLYRGSVSPYDIALLKLKTALEFNTYVKPIGLPEANALTKGPVILSGWGSTSKTETPVLPDILQKATLTIVDLNTCRNAMQSLNQPWEIHETNLCTGPLTGQLSACYGDSGGPLVEKNKNGVSKVVGIVSWGVNPCAIVGAPAIFVRVSAFIDWIDNIMRKF